MWTLEVDYPEGLERADFQSREEAVEHAVAIMNDYTDAIRVKLIDPNGNAEAIENPASALGK
jgi:predicted metalloenzyme YecM